jgi:uncharacterized membrane protein (UPF0127 family)
MAWVLREGEVLASLEIAVTRRARRRGLLGRGGIDGAILLRPCRAVHTIGMRFPIDVAFLNGEMRVMKVVSLRPWRLTLPVRRARAVLEAERGAFGSWELRPGDELEIKE